MANMNVAVTVTNGSEVDLLNGSLVGSANRVRLESIMAFNVSDSNTALEILDGAGGSVIYHVGLPTGYEPQRDGWGRPLEVETSLGNTLRVKGTTASKTIRVFAVVEIL